MSQDKVAGYVKTHWGLINTIISTGEPTMAMAFVQSWLISAISYQF